MEVCVDVSENDIFWVVLGDLVEIEVDVYVDRKFRGIVIQIVNFVIGVGIIMVLNSD